METKQMARQVRLTHWSGIFRERSESGLSVRSWCSKNGVHEKTYYYWQRKLREAACEGLAKLQNEKTISGPPVFTEVHVVDKHAALPPVSGTQNQICIDAAGLRITAGMEYPAEKLTELLRGLVRPC